MPRYETQHDLHEEEKFRFYLRKSFGVDLNKLSEAKYELDFSMHKEKKLIGFAEFKVRSVNHDHYHTYMISLNKWIKGLELESRTGCKFRIFVCYKDGYYVYTADKDHVHILELGGRKDRNNPGDIEPCVFIDTQLFKPI